MDFTRAFALPFERNLLDWTASMMRARSENSKSRSTRAYSTGWRWECARNFHYTPTKLDPNVINPQSRMGIDNGVG